MSGSATGRCGLIVGPWANIPPVRNRKKPICIGFIMPAVIGIRLRTFEPAPWMPAFAEYDRELGPALPLAAGLLICPTGKSTRLGAFACRVLFSVFPKIFRF